MTDNVTAVATKIDWSSLSGVILDGGYELKEVLDGRDNAAKLRVRILGSGGKTGLAYFLHLEPADAADQLDIWQTLRDASHPNLSRPVVLGKREVSGIETVFAVFADPDEKLAAVVPERPLEWEEAAEVLHSCEKGLAHLHAHGLIHGSVSPDTVEAIGYSVLLNTADVRRMGKKPRVEWSQAQYVAPESKGANLTTASDVWCLGATLFEVLSQEPYGTPGAELERGMPLAGVILRCLDKNPTTRCTLKDAPAIASAPVAESAPAAAAPTLEPEAPKPIAAEPAASVPTPAAATPTATPSPASRPVDNRIPGAGSSSAARGTSGSRIPQPLTPKAPAKQVTKEDMALVPVGKRHKRVQKRQPVGARIRTLDGPVREMGPITTGEEEESDLSATPAVGRILAVGNRPKLIRNALACAGLALVVFGAVRFVIIPRLESTQAPLNTVSAQTTKSDARPDLPENMQIASPSANNTSGSSATPALPTPDTSSTQKPASEAAAATTPARPAVNQEFYRVVVSSHNSRLEANKALEAFSQQHPDLMLHVAGWKGEGREVSKYLVAVGGVLTQSEAQELNQRLQNEGIKTSKLEPLKNIAPGR